jgi:glycerophosphoryl diester phosphodiesterase
LDDGDGGPPVAPARWRGWLRPRRFIGLVSVGVLLGVGAAALLAAAPSTTRVFPQVPRPAIFAHRGGAAEGPESTLPTMLDVIARNPQVVIELDVHQSRDGHIVVNHDGAVDRTTNGSGRLVDLTLAELRALDAGFCATPGEGAGTAPPEICRDPGQAHRFPLRGKGFHIATLDEVLDGLPATTAIAIEVKASGFEEQLAVRLRASGRGGRLIVGSGRDDIAAKLRVALPEVPEYFPRWAGTRLALGIKLADGRISRPQHEVLAIPTHGAGLVLDTPGLVATAHRLGVYVVYFIIDEADEMERLLRLGADALITDYPSRARAVSDRLIKAQAGR